MQGSNRTAVRNTVRVPGAPFARPRAHSGNVLINRESNALRTSVMDIAMEIGLGMNGAVTDWVYNNPINEEEEESVTSPSLTAGSSVSSDACSSTSSARFLYSPPASSRSISSSTKSLTSLQKSFSPSAFSIPEESSSIFQTDTEPLCATPTPPVSASITFSDFSMPLSVRLPSKLRKRRTDGHESESGYTSDTKGKKKDKKEKVGTTGESSASDDKSRAKEEKELAKRQKEAARQRVKSLTSKRSEKDSLASKGYETDAPTRKGFGKKKKSGDAEYETDAGYFSSGSPASGLKKAKARFFRLSRKSSKPDLVASVAKMPPSIPLSFPFAHKSSTTLNSNGVESLPVLPPLPSLDTDLLCTIPAENPAPSNGPSLASPPPITPSDPLGRVKSASSKKDSLSEMGVRNSQMSGESSGSSISNASTGFSQESRASRLKSFRFLSPSKSSSALPPSKFPSISLPLTRATSPAPLDAGNNDANQCQDPAGSLSPDILGSPKLHPTARGSVIQEIRGRSPASPASSAFISPTSSQRSLSPALSNPTSPSVIISPAASAPSSPAISRAPSLKAQANLTSHRLSPVSLKRFSRGRSPSPIPSSEWIVPSPPTTSIAQSIYAGRTSLPVPSPSIYSVHDLPPPSPPPNAPLPKVPVVAENNVEDDPFGVNGASVIRSLNQPEGGKDMSFLARLRGQSVSNNNTKTSERSLVQTIRRISKQAITTPPSVVISGSSSQRQSDSSMAEEVYDDVCGDQELQDVLDRFISELSSSGDKHEVAGMALGRRKSSEALRNDGPSSSEPTPGAGEDNEDDAEPQHSPDLCRRRQSTLYYSDMEEDGADPRLSRWSGSIYSRASFMDPQKSEETRARFVKRVEAMLDEAGIERGNKRDWDAVPPVPKLPEALAQSNRLTRQNQLKGAGPTPNANGWI